MDDRQFDSLARGLGESGTRRQALALLAGAASLPLLGAGVADAKKHKRKKKKKKKCTPRCTGCGGSNGCGGTCGCGSNQLCESGVCRTCDVTCSGDAISCGSALRQRLTDGGTIFVCPGRYQGTFTMGTAKLVGAGPGDNPVTSTILDAALGGRVVTITAGATAELVGLRITRGKVISGGEGGGVQAGAGDLRITRCTIVGNEAPYGGGISAQGAFRLTNSTVSQNTAGSRGGGMMLLGTQPSFLTDSVISSNQAAGSGGGGLYTTSNLTVVGTDISGNGAASSGGGIQNYGMITFNATSRVIGNTAPSYGGISNPSGTVTLNGAQVSGNSAPQCLNVPGCS